MMEFLEAVNDCLYRALDGVALTYGIVKIDDDLITSEVDSLPFKFYYKGTKYVTAHTLIYKEFCWELSLVRHNKNGAEPETVFLTFNGEICNERGNAKN